MSQKRPLPEGYTRLQYIYTTSNAYIDTGVLIDSNDIIDTQWEALPGFRKSVDAMVCGVRPKAFSINLYYGETDVYVGFGGSNYRAGSQDQRIRVEGGFIYGYRDGKVINRRDATSVTYSATKPLYLFCMNNGSNVAQYPLKYVGIKYFTIEDKWSGTPCIDPNGVVGIYDAVNDNFHTSPNGTAFLAGPVYE